MGGFHALAGQTVTLYVRYRIAENRHTNLPCVLQNVHVEQGAQRIAHSSGGAGRQMIKALVQLGETQSGRSYLPPQQWYSQTMQDCHDKFWTVDLQYPPILQVGGTPLVFGQGTPEELAQQEYSFLQKNSGIGKVQAAIIHRYGSGVMQHMELIAASGEMGVSAGVKQSFTSRF